MSYEKLNELIDQRKEKLFNGCFTEYFYRMVIIRLEHLLKYVKNNNLEYNDKTRESFRIYEQGHISSKTHCYINYALEILENGVNYLKKHSNACNIQGLKEIITLSQYNQKVFDEYMKEVKTYNYGQTIIQKEKTVKQIINFFQNKGVNNYDDLNISMVNEFELFYLSLGYSKAKKYSWVFKDFISFLYNNKYIKTNYNYLLENVKCVNNKNIPITFSFEEINSITNSLSDKTPIDKRNKAIILIAIRLGMRIGDIINLKFDNINWITNEITFIQEKTKVINKLPLTEEIGNAIIDYVKNGRPKTTLRYIFVTHDENISKLSGKGNLRNYLIKIYNVANINPNIQKGTHIFRQSLASEMLKNENSLKIISSTLGHVNQNSAKNYLKIDNNKLEICCMEVPKYD